MEYCLQNKLDESILLKNIAWRAIPGQLALTSTPRPNGIKSVIVANAEHPSGVALADLSGDGRLDVIVADPVSNPFENTGQILWWENAPGGEWIARRVGDFYGASHVDAADVDRDGDLDVIAAAHYGMIERSPPPTSSRNGRYAWFENVDGAGNTWVEHTVGQLYWGARWIDAGDIDGDGDIDLVGASELTGGVFEQDGDIVYFENLDGAGTSWRAHDLETNFGSGFEAHIADIPH